MAFEHLASALAARKAAGLLRSRQVIAPLQGRQFSANGQPLLDFSSNDYLGLQGHEGVSAAWADGLKTYGNGSGASPLVTGYSQAHHELELHLASSLQREAVLLFNSGFAANQALCQALMADGGSVVADKLSHASLIDGALASNAKLVRFRHNDLQHAETLLKKAQGPTLLVTEGIFSMDGDAAPLTELASLAKQYDAWLMVDDAHGFGWLGDSGMGSAQAAELDQQQLPVLMGTFGKAVGTAGAFIAGSQVLIDYLINYGRHYVYSTAMPPAQAAATLSAIKILQDSPLLRQNLANNIQWFKQCAVQKELQCLPSDSPIQPIVCGDSESALAISQRLRQQGFSVVAIRPPTVPQGTSRLRVTLSATQSKDDISGLVIAIADEMKKA